ncbi:MarR family transcriptional regulator [Anaerolineales bacterium HSG6]|nr:MarR family transcriptional regulator [Anaerolineales bacterium HSG6]MDM8532828.1 MarR family transcriptional regulator [Anaerolineales bacterium HSG25]
MTDIIETRRERIISIRDAFISLMWTAQRQFSIRLQPFGLTKPQFMALSALAAHNQPCTMGDLREVTFQDGPTMTGIINRLIKMGYVERTRSQVDRRVVLVQVADAGIEVVKQIEQEALHDDLCGYAALNDDELTNMEQLLTYTLRMYLRRYMASQNVDVEETLKKLKMFKKDPIYYAKMHNGKHHAENGANP